MIDLETGSWDELTTGTRSFQKHSANGLPSVTLGIGFNGKELFAECQSSGTRQTRQRLCRVTKKYSANIFFKNKKNKHPAPPATTTAHAAATATPRPPAHHARPFRPDEATHGWQAALDLWSSGSRACAVVWTPPGKEGPLDPRHAAATRSVRRIRFLGGRGSPLWWRGGGGARAGFDLPGRATAGSQRGRGGAPAP